MIIARHFYFFFSLALLLSAPLPARAFYQSIADLFVKDLSYFGQAPHVVPFTSPAYCEAVVENLAPNAVIIDGLMAIENLQRPAAEEAFLSCLPQVKKSWEAEIAKFSGLEKYFLAAKFPYVWLWQDDPIGQTPLELARAFQYSWKRVLYAHQAYLKRGGKISDAKSFCASYQSELKRDQIFAKTYQTSTEILTSGNGVKFGSEYGLTEAEVSSVQEYTGPGYLGLNSSLRKNELDETSKNFVDVVNSSLKKAKGYEGLVVRYDCLPPAVASEHKWGKAVTYAAFTSTSFRMSFDWTNSCESDTWTPRRVLICTKGVGVNVQLISANPVEDEVLFPSGSKFELVDKFPLPGSDRTELHVMVALDEKGKRSTNPQFCQDEVKKYQDVMAVSTTGAANRLKELEQELKEAKEEVEKLEGEKKVAEASSTPARLAESVALLAKVEALQKEQDALPGFGEVKTEAQRKKYWDLGKSLAAMQKQYHQSNGGLPRIKEELTQAVKARDELEPKLAAARADLLEEQNHYKEQLKKFEAEKKAYLKK